MTIPKSGCLYGAQRFSPCGSFKKHLAGNLSATVVSLKPVTSSRLQISDADFLYAGIQGASLGKAQMSTVTTLKSGVHHLLHMCRV